MYVTSCGWHATPMFGKQRDLSVTHESDTAMVPSHAELVALAVAVDRTMFGLPECSGALQGLSRGDPGIDPAQKRPYLLEPCLLQESGGNGGRCLIWTGAIHPDL